MTPTDSLRRSLMVLALVVVAGYMLYLLAPILTPFLISVLLAYISDPLVDRLEVRRVPRTLAVIVVFIVYFIAFLLIVLVLVPIFHQQVVAFAGRLPGSIDWLQTQLLPWFKEVLGTEAPALNLENLKQQLMQHWRELGSWIGGVFNWMTQKGLRLLWLLFSLILIPVVTFYLLRDWDRIVARIDRLVAPRRRARVRAAAKEVDEVLAGFMRGQLLVMLALAFIYSVGLSIVGLDLALPIGTLAGLVSFVPYFGLIVGLLVAGVAALLQFQDPLALIGVALVFGVGQLLESFLLTPRLVGDRLGLHPVAVIFAILAGGQLFGFFGILLALPAAAVLLVLLRHVMQRHQTTTGKRKKRRQTT